MKNENQKREAVEKNWIVASQNLQFEMIIPYKFNFKSKEKKAFAFLPNYGSENGMIVNLITPPQFQTDSEIIEWAKENNYFYSFLNIESYLEYDEDVITETLEDWGNFKNKIIVATEID